MRVLITGITGFVGSHFAEYLLNKNDIEIYGIMRWRSDTKNIKHIKRRSLFISGFKGPCKY
jgi:GDP-D-mannose dehydratase